MENNGQINVDINDVVDSFQALLNVANYDLVMERAKSAACLKEIERLKEELAKGAQ